MTHAISTIHNQPAPAQIEQLKTSWQDLLRSPLDTLEARNEVAMKVDALLVPCPAPKLMHRVLALLAPYYSNDIPQSVREIEAEDWLFALAEYPEWAVIAAARWWKGENNPDRRKRPLDGDIAARANQEIGFAKVAEWAVKRFDQGIRPSPPMTLPERKAPEPVDMERRRAFANELISSRFPSNRTET